MYEKNVSFTTYLGYPKIGKHSVGRDDKKGVFPFQKTEPFDRISTVIWEDKMATLKINQSCSLPETWELYS